MILQEKIENEKPLKTIPCGIDYLKETIGLSLTNNHFYQFLFLNETVEIIRYEQNQRLSKNNNDQNEYKLNLIDGQMMANKLEDLINERATEYLTVVFRWNGEKDSRRTHLKIVYDEQPIISIAYTMNKQKQNRIVYYKTFDKITYYLANHNEELNMRGFDMREKRETDEKYIMSLLSNQSDGMFAITYSKNHYNITIIKMTKKLFLQDDYEWKKSLVVDEDLNFFYEFDGKPNERYRQKLTKLFAQIFDQHIFTYGFINDNNQIFIFSNQNEKLLTFSFNSTGDDEIDSNQKYPFKLQHYKDFFHCSKQVEPINIDDHDNNKPDNTTIKKPWLPFDLDDIINKKINISISISGIIVASIVIFSILIGLFIYCLRKKSGKKNPVKKLPLTTSPKQQVGKFSTDSSISPTMKVTMTEQSVTASSMISKTPATTSKVMETSLPISSISETPISTQMAGKSTLHSSIPTMAEVSGMSSSLHSSISKTPATTTSKVSGKLVPLSSMSKTPTATSKVGEKLVPLSSMSKTPTTTTSKVSGKLLPLSTMSTNMKMFKN